MAVQPNPPRTRKAPAVALLEAKLRPPQQRTGIVARPALVERLRSRPRVHPVATIEAPAGYGKTTLAAEFAATEHRATAWYTLDEQDNEPVVFLTYLAAAFARAGVPLGAIEPRIAELTAAVAALRAPVVVVLDNLELLDEPTCLRCVDALAAALPSESQLVLVSRGRTDLPRLDDDRTLRLTTPDLRLSAAEAAALVRTASLDLTPAEAELLNDHCAGWAAGLYLLARAGREAVERLPGSVDRFVDDYFQLELLSGLDTKTRRLLLDVSLVDEICGPLCDAMTGGRGSAARLTDLAGADLFVEPIDDSGTWFELHPLLRTLLRTSASLDTARAATLLGRAATWYERRGDLEAAVECALAAKDRHRAATLITDTLLPAWWHGRAEAVERWLAAVDDPRIVSEHPALAVQGAALLALRGRAEAASRWARLSQTVEPDLVMPDGSPASAWLATLRALLCEHGIDAAFRDAQTAIATLADGSRLRSSAHVSVAFGHLLQGDDALAREWLVRTDDVAKKLGSNVGASVANATIALEAVARGDRREAVYAANRARSIVRATGLEEYFSTTLVDAADARVALLNGDTTVARAAVLHADALLPHLTFAQPWLAAYVRLELAHAQLALDNAARAAELLDEIDEILRRRPHLGAIEVRAEQLRESLRAGRSAADGWESTLTPAELRLLPMLASYLSFRDIADRLSISRNTVKTQAIAVYRKLEVSSRTEAVERARELGLLKNS